MGINGGKRERTVNHDNINRAISCGGVRFLKIFLRNIGKVKAAEVEINGITVIAGENNTGKSTFGRALFAVFNSFYNVEEQIIQERKENVEILLNFFFRNPAVRMQQIPDTDELAKTIVDNIDEYRNASADQFKKILFQDDESYENRKEKRITFSELVERIREGLNVSDMQVLNSIIGKKLDAEFNGQICNIFSDDDAEIGLTIQDHSIVIRLQDDTVIDIDNSIGLHTEAVYIDDPFVVDEIISSIRYFYPDHRIHLMDKLLPSSSKETNIVNEIVTNQKFERIYEKLSSVCGGDIVRNKRSLGYRRKNSEKIIDVRNLSTGLKTFVILKMLFLNEVLEYNGTIILDEPEIHLHPEWQLLFAELIVLLHKEYGMHILLNTHSPYFLRAIQVYSEKHGVDAQCKYYLSEVINDLASLQDVTECVDKIYEKLSSPFQKLENVRWEDD